jgi:ferric-dicitrate binding protein FerR (iron transport regulator)
LSAHGQTQLLLDGQLSGAERAEAEQHLETCAECRALAQGWTSFASRYRADTAALIAEPTVDQTRQLLRRAREGAQPLRARWLTFALAGAAAAVLAVVVVSWGLQTPELVPALAVAADGSEVPLSGDVLEAPAEKGAALHLGGDQLGVAPRSRLKLLTHDKRNVRLLLERGAVAASVQHRNPGQSFAIQSDGYEVRVVGTRFRVTRTDQGLTVDVAEGHVKVRSPQGETYDVLKGHSLTVGAAGAEEQKDYGAADFPELHPEAAPPVAEAPAEEPALEETGATPRPRLVTSADIERWRRAAVGGKKCREVLPELKRALRDSPRQADAWRILADCQRLTGEDAEAARSYEKVVSFAKPDEADRARLLLADLQAKGGNSAEAEHTLRAYLKHAQPPALEASARLSLARALLAQGHRGEAKAELQRVTRRLPSTPPALEALELLKTIDAR